jgi:hypothetical protein
MKRIRCRLETLCKGQVRMALRIVMLIAALLILLFGKGELATIGWANGGTTVSIDPASQGVFLGDTATTDVLVGDVTDLYGVEFQLTFDPTLVEVVDANPSKPGIQIQPGDFLSPDWLLDNIADNANGSIDYALSQRDPSPPKSGSGVLAVITWRGKAVGTSPVHFTYVLLGAPGGAPIPASTQDGQIMVCAAGQIDGIIYEENDGELGQGPDDPGIVGATVKLYRDLSPIGSKGSEDQFIEQTTTGSDPVAGYFKFIPPHVGSYIVEQAELEEYQEPSPLYYFVSVNCETGGGVSGNDFANELIPTAVSLVSFRATSGSVDLAPVVVIAALVGVGFLGMTIGRRRRAGQPRQTVRRSS